MKLIIDIPEHILDTIQADEMISREQLAVLQMHILKGIPLDDVKAEIEKLDEGITSYRNDNPWVYKSEVLMILDNIGKAESEE